MSSYVGLRCVIVLGMLTFHAQALELISKPETIRSQDTDVELICYVSNKTNNAISELSILRITKLSKGTVWKPIAVFERNQEIINSDKNALTSGHMDHHLSGAYLKLTWPFAFPNIVGKYKCDAVGNTVDGSIAMDASKELHIHSLSLDSAQRDNFNKDEVEKFKKIMHGILNDSLSNVVSEVEGKLKSVESDLNSQINQIVSKIAIKLKPFELFMNKSVSSFGKMVQVDEKEKKLLWPEGHFTLVMPDTGCPSINWNKGFIKYREGSENYFPIDSAQHFAFPYKMNEFVYKQFCSLKASNQRPDHWPAGSYCLHQTYSSACPSGFHSTKLLVDNYDSGSNYWYGTIPTGDNHDYSFNVYFCCRHDGKSENPITLPVSKPFYLFRHKGSCQKVKGMDFRPEVFMMRTEKGGSNDDRWVSGYDAVYRPDVSLNPIREKLCYYYKKE